MSVHFYDDLKLKRLDDDTLFEECSSARSMHVHYQAADRSTKKLEQHDAHKMGCYYQTLIYFMVARGLDPSTGIRICSDEIVIG